MITVLHWIFAELLYSCIPQSYTHNHNPDERRQRREDTEEQTGVCGY